ncbi:MAG: hypothetical protein QM398_11500 [Thermoproteota archaeon]|nr:hypothetical protein [Thermoproteota archaeon]
MSLRALVTPGNRCDGPYLPKLIEVLEADFVLAECWLWPRGLVKKASMVWLASSV